MLLAWLAAVMGFLQSSLGRVAGWLRYQSIFRLKLFLHPSARRQPAIDDLRDDDILYRSEHFIVANKGCDVVVNSEEAKYPVSLATQLAHKFPQDVDPTTKFQFRFLHRLDYATSGAICVALTKLGARRGHRAFEKHYVTKHYIALVRGHVDASRYGGMGHDINLPIGRDTRETQRCVMCTPPTGTGTGDGSGTEYCEAPRHASTRAVVLQHGLYYREPASLMLLIPHTGRTHQLRVHLHVSGHPIVGDYTYSRGKDWRPVRMMLHAHRLVIPMKHEHIDVAAPVPFLDDPGWEGGEEFDTYAGYIGRFGLRTDKQPVQPPPQKPPRKAKTKTEPIVQAEKEPIVQVEKQSIVQGETMKETIVQAETSEETIVQSETSKETIVPTMLEIESIVQAKMREQSIADIDKQDRLSEETNAIKPISIPS